MRPVAVLAMIAALGAPPGALAQVTGAPALSDPTAAWTLAVPKTPGHAKKATPRTRPVPPEEAARAARLAEARRRFFEEQGAPPKPEKVPEFGGYDAATMSGDGRTGMGFKF